MERRLEILKDLRVGAFGLLAGALALLVQFATLAAVPLVAPLVAAVVGRWVMALSLSGWCSTRPDSLGARFASDAKATVPILVAWGLLTAIGFVAGPARIAVGAAAALLAGMVTAAWLWTGGSGGSPATATARPESSTLNEPPPSYLIWSSSPLVGPCPPPKRFSPQPPITRPNNPLARLFSIPFPATNVRSPETAERPCGA